MTARRARPGLCPLRLRPRHPHAQSLDLQPRWKFPFNPDLSDDLPLTSTQALNGMLRMRPQK
jgi:hypothetical protein